MYVTSRVTTGGDIGGRSEGSSPGAGATTPALDFSSRTTARRTVQTLIGSYDALRTSTRPPSRPRRRCSSGDVDLVMCGGVSWVIGRAPGGTVASTTTEIARFEPGSHPASTA